MAGSPTRLGDRLRPFALVAAGAVLGAGLRYAVSLAVPSGPLPWATLVVNGCGSFALGALLSESALRSGLSPETRLVVGTGFLSSFTTYSAFAVETAGLAPSLAVLNVGSQYTLGLLAVVAGRWAAREVLA